MRAEEESGERSVCWEVARKSVIIWHAPFQPTWRKPTVQRGRVASLCCFSRQVPKSRLVESP